MFDSDQWDLGDELIKCLGLLVFIVIAAFMLREVYLLALVMEAVSP